MTWATPTAQESARISGLTDGDAALCTLAIATIGALTGLDFRSLSI